MMRRLLALTPIIASLLTSVAVAQSQSIHADDEIARLVQKLYTTQVGNTQRRPSHETELEPRWELYTIAHRSTEQRSKVVKALIDFLEETLKENTGPAEGTAWWVGVYLLGDLGAIEAIDVLVKYIAYDYRYKYGIDYDYPTPACEGLSGIGKPALPKLIEVLSNGKVVAVQVYAAWTLGHIGGTEAKAGLEQALARETNVQVRTAIVSALLEIRGKSHRK